MQKLKKGDLVEYLVAAPTIKSMRFAIQLNVNMVVDILIRRYIPRSLSTEAGKYAVTGVGPYSATSGTHE